jgi:H+/gluconate symporter-like permease
MKEIIDKISSYNLFNYLFPGIIFVIILREITKYDLVQENNILGAFLYYFIGLIISRFGSLIIGKILQSKKLKFIKFADYSEFIFASDKDKKIELFSEINNMYRTLISLFCLLLFSILYQKISDWLNISESLSYILLIISLIVLFVFSYRKQTGFITKRVATRNKENK